MPENEFEAVLHLGLSSAWYSVSDFLPFVANLQPFFKEINIILYAPSPLVDGWIQGVEPPFPALLPVPLDIARIAV